jgi:hypothetical protein
MLCCLMSSNFISTHSVELKRGRREGLSDHDWKDVGIIDKEPLKPRRELSADTRGSQQLQGTVRYLDLRTLLNRDMFGVSRRNLNGN